MVDASDATATDADTGARLGVLANQLPSAVDVPPAADDAAAALMADKADATLTAPCTPAGKASMATAVDDPGAMSTVTVAAPGN